MSIWPSHAYVSTKRSPCARMMSATSKGGRPAHRLCSRRERRAASGPRIAIAIASNGLATACKMPSREMQVQDGLLEFYVAEQQLNRAQVGPAFEQMRGVQPRPLGYAPSVIAPPNGPQRSIFR